MKTMTREHPGEIRHLFCSRGVYIVAGKVGGLSLRSYEYVGGSRISGAKVLTLLLSLLVPLGVHSLGATDVIPPGAITDLAVGRPSIAPQLHLTLTWSAPGDDGTTGTALSYDIRFRTDAPITEANWASATQVTYGLDPGENLVSSEPAPKVASSLERFTVVGLKPNTIYFWAIKASDEVANTSAISNSPSLATAKYEGYGYQSAGGGGQTFCEVSNTSDSGAGSLRNCIAGNRYIVFSAKGTINMASTMDARVDNITIDGSTAPFPGITIHAGSACLNDGLRFGASGTTRSHQIMTYLRFVGNDMWGDTSCVAPSCCAGGSCKADCGSCESCDDLTGLVGTSSGSDARHVVFDHLTVSNAGDTGLNLSGIEHDVTVSHTIIMMGSHPFYVSPSSGSAPQSARISIHHNLMARNADRNLFVIFDHDDVDVRNNVIFDYAYDPQGSARGYGSVCCGMHVGNVSARVNLNIVNNYFRPFQCSGIAGCTVKDNKALYYGASPGWDSEEGGSSYSGCKKQGTIYTASGMGEIWTAGNVFPAANCDEYSTVSSARPMPSAAQVITDAATSLWSTVLPNVGTRFRTPAEDALVADVDAAFQHGAPICGNNTAELPEICDGSDLSGGTCLSLGFTGGTLRCSSDCRSYDTSQCLGGGAPSDVQNLHRSDTTSP